MARKPNAKGQAKAKAKAQGKAKNSPGPQRHLVARPKPKPVGRPSIYTDKLAATICERVASGEFITAICAERGMPSAQAISEWRKIHPKFGEAYYRARELQAQSVAELGLAEAMKAGAELDPAAARVRFEASRWMAGKLAPRTYGDKVEVAGSAENPLTLLIQEVQGRAIKPVRFINGEAEDA